MDCSILDLTLVYDDLDKHIIDNGYDVCSFVYDPYSAKEVVERWCREN